MYKPSTEALESDELGGFAGNVTAEDDGCSVKLETEMHEHTTDDDSLTSGPHIVPSVSSGEDPGVGMDDDATTETAAYSRPPTTMFTCPICQCENLVSEPNKQHSDATNKELDILIESRDWRRVIAATVGENKCSTYDDEGESQDGSRRHNNDNQVPTAYETQNVFSLQSCGHQFCTSCLYAYVQSQLLEGSCDIPCCHFILPTETQQGEEEGEFRTCGVAMIKDDIYRLIHTACCNSESSLGEWCSGSDTCKQPSFVKSQTSYSPVQLWEKYEKLAFDKYHGNCVRRCPRCDDARLFCVESMKQHQKSIMTQANDVASGNIAVTRRETGGNATQLGHILGAIRTRKQTLEDLLVDSTIADVPLESTTTLEATNIDGVASMRGEATHESERGEPAKGDHEIIKNTGVEINEGGFPLETPLSMKSESLQKSTSPIVACSTCNTEFCYFHSNAHTGDTCLSYHNKTLELDRANLAYANVNLRSKPCPICGILVSKEGGCNQMKCGNCGTHFCWLCRTVIDDGAFPEHFRWWNLNGCPNLQLDESDEPMRCTVWGARILSVFQLVVLGIPALCMTFLTAIICPCLIRGIGHTNRERLVNCISFWGSVLSTLLLMPFTFLGMIILAAMYCFLASLIFLLKASKAIAHPRSAARANNPATGSEGSMTDTSVAMQSRLAGATTSSDNDLVAELERIFADHLETMEDGGVEM